MSVPEVGIIYKLLSVIYIMNINQWQIQDYFQEVSQNF